MRTTHVRLVALCLALVAVVAACEDDEASGPDGPYTLTFSGDATFQGPHGGQMVTVAVVDAGVVVSTDQATVSETADPAFSFTFTDALESGTAYEVHYWIDSNFGEGSTEGACDDDINIDHQWSVDLGTATGDVTHTEVHNVDTRSPVCNTFD